MADTTFSPGTTITSDWLNDVNDSVYNGISKLPTTMFANLPSISTVPVGTRAVVSDSSVNSFYSVVAGGGSYVIPVFSDGTNWRVG